MMQHVKLILLIAQRFSRVNYKNKLVSFISISSIIGIAIGVAVIIIGLSAMNGFEKELQNRILGIIAHGQLHSLSGSLKNYNELQKQVLQAKDVIGVAPYIEFTALVEYGINLKAVAIKAIDTELDAQVSNLQSFIDFDPNLIIQDPTKQYLLLQNDQIILGKGVADNLQVKLGDYVTLLVANTKPYNEQSLNEPVKLSLPKRKRMQLVGIINLNGQIDHMLGLVSLSTGQQILNLEHEVTGIAIKTNDVFSADQIVQEAANVIDYHLHYKSWKQDYGFLYRDIQLVRTIMYIVMVLVIGVACFNVISTLIMIVKDRASEIAILRTMGANDLVIISAFMGQGIFSSLFGSAIGSVVGSTIASNLTAIIVWIEQLTGYEFLSGDIYFINFLPSHLVVSDVLIVSLTAMMLSILATLYPAYRAIKINPVQILNSK